MAELVGLVASVLQLVDVVSKTRSYIVDFHDAPQDQQRLLLETQSLEPLIRELNGRIQNNHTAGSTGGGLQELAEPLIRLKATLVSLTKTLNPDGLSKASSRLTWPLWGKEEVGEKLNAIERFKSLLNSWLGIGIWSVITPVPCYSAHSR
jgi:hypothetical protein